MKALFPDNAPDGSERITTAYGWLARLVNRIAAANQPGPVPAVTQV